MLFLAAGLATLFFRARRVRLAELSLIIPLLLALASVLISNVSIGFRHSIPWYVFSIMLASRCAQGPARKWVLVVAWCGVIATGIDGMRWHPDELSYFNLPWRQPGAIISDSNIDWGQSLKQMRQWAEHALPAPGPARFKGATLHPRHARRGI